MWSLRELLVAAVAIAILLAVGLWCIVAGIVLWTTLTFLLVRTLLRVAVVLGLLREVSCEWMSTAIRVLRWEKSRVRLTVMQLLLTISSDLGMRLSLTVAAEARQLVLRRLGIGGV